MSREENENRIWERQNLAYCLAWSRTDQAWIVYTSYSGHESDVRIHNERHDADADFDARVAEFEERYRRHFGGRK